MSPAHYGKRFYFHEMFEDFQTIVCARLICGSLAVEPPVTMSEFSPDCPEDGMARVKQRQLISPGSTNSGNNTAI
jgi:hypothetical protein